jgi:hypothetical protein
MIVFDSPPWVLDLDLDTSCHGVMERHVSAKGVHAFGPGKTFYNFVKGACGKIVISLGQEGTKVVS